SVISMGLISLPIMLRYGYDRRIAAGVITASGTLAQIIPPSLVLIILADQLGRSVGDMYKGAFLPGFLLTGFYAGYVMLLAVFKPKWVPALPLEARVFREPGGSSGTPSLLLLTIVSAGAAIFFGQHIADVHRWWGGQTVTTVAKDETIVVSLCVGVMLAFVIAVINKVTRLGLLSRMAERVTFVLIPPLLLIFLVLGTIFLGVATPTEGGAMGALGALTMALVRGRMSFLLLRQALTATTKLSCFVVFILIGSTIFSLVFQGVDGPRWVEHLLTSLPGGQVGFLIVVNVMIFFLAFFLDFFELSFIVVPLLAPVAQSLGIDLIWFGVLLAVNMQTSFMHPPFGFALFYLRSVAPTLPYTDRITKKQIEPVTTMQIYRGAVPFVLIQIIMVGLIIAFPGIVSGELDKPKAVDMEKIRLQMEADINRSESAEGAAYGADANADANRMPEPEAIEAPAVNDNDLFKPSEGAASGAKK
ncbi:MAG: TRAP transporter large permease subunit, partial [Polaromonas sp.]